MHTRRFLALLFSLTAIACTGGADANPDITRADSAGVKIITSGARDTALAWTFEEVDVFRDSADAPYLFTNVSRVVVLADRAGRTYVLTRDPSVVRFGRDGKHDLTLGRRGGGPGEFQFPMGIGSQGDTIWVLDAAKRALVRFASDLSPVSDQRLEGALERAEMLIFRTGGVWFRRMGFDSTGMTSEIIGDTLTMRPMARVVAPPGKPVEFACGVSLSMGMQILAPVATFHGGGARVLVNTQPRYELQLYEGPRLIGSVRRPIEPHAPTPDDVALHYPEGMRIGLGEGRFCVVPIPEMMEKLGVADLAPLVHDVTLLPDGSMWVLRTPHQAPPVVDVFGPDGVYAGTMRGRGLPLARLPNGELLFAKQDEESGGQIIARVKVTR